MCEETEPSYEWGGAVVGGVRVCGGMRGERQERCEWLVVRRRWCERGS